MIFVLGNDLIHNTILYEFFFSNLPLAHKKSYKPVLRDSSSIHLPTNGGSAKMFGDNETMMPMTNT